MNNKVLKFDLDPKTLKVKEILNSDFLELEIKAISTAYPNRNGSHFTLESLKDAIPTFYNKPLLGSFSSNKDDFRGHEGELDHDNELDNWYYDYTDESSETPLGLIRSTDKITIYHEKKDDLDWIKFTCAIWVKYNYKQVKKLLKSKDGHKKVSVEIEVLDSTIDEQGIEVINKFIFDGVTILGDNLETGIADANLSILEMVDNALFQKKQQCLAFAYTALDKVENPAKQDSNININKFDQSTPLENEGEPEIKMEEEPGEKVIPNEENQEKGGMPAMPVEQLTMKAKLDLLESALREAICPPAENAEEGEVACCCYIWVMDICDKFVYYEFEGEKFRCPYMFITVEGENKVILSLDAIERVVPTWSVFSEEQPEEDEDNIETEACGDKTSEACGDKVEEACGDKTSEACGDKVEEACGQKQSEACGEEKFDHEGEEGEGHKCIECAIRDLIIDEEEAIQGYSHAEKHFEEQYPLIAKIFHEIKEEEEVHIGELQQALQMVNDETNEHTEEGIEEAKQIVAEEILEQNEEAQKEEGLNGEESSEVIVVEFSDVEAKLEMPTIEQPISDTPDTGATKDDKPNATPATSDAVDTDVKSYDDDEEDDDNDDESDGVEEPKEEEPKEEEPKEEEPNKDEDDDEDKEDDNEEDDEDDEDKEDDTEPKEEPKEEDYAIAESQEVTLNGEPLPVDTSKQSMPEIVAESVASVLAPGVQTEAGNLGDATKEAQSVLNKDTESEIIGLPSEMPESIAPKIDPLADKVEQPKDNEKALDFSSNAESISPEMKSLLEKYAELEAKFNELNDAKKHEEAQKLAKFGADFINEDKFVDKDAKQDYVAQVEEKCYTFELNSEDEVIKFAKSLMAMYYYEKQSINKKSTHQELSISINRPTHVENGASSNNKLKDAINKLNYLNKEE